MKNFLKKYGWIIIFLFMVFPYVKEGIWNFQNIFFEGEAEGIIFDKKLNKQPRKTGASKGVIFYPLISYCYKVEDVEYCNTDAVDLDIVNYIEATKKLQEYEINSTIKVFYDKIEPNKSSLEKRTLVEFINNSFVFIIIILTAIFIFPRVLVYITKYVMKKFDQKNNKLNNDV